MQHQRRKTNSTPTDPYDFSIRHIGPTAADLDQMLAVIGADSIGELMDQTIPAGIRRHVPLDCGPALTETEMLALLRQIASKNKRFVSLIGQGYYGTILPPVIQRNILENPAWYTAYTPYQPEISQGRLEALLNFQTMIIDLTGLDIANASLLDEGTAAAEAMAMAYRLAGGGKSAFFVDADCHPQTIAILRTRAHALGWRIIIGDPKTQPSEVFGALLQYPGSSGEIRNFSHEVAALHNAGALAVIAADPLALVLLKPPGEFGADIVVGSTQRFGVPVGYGGPHAAYIATRDEYKRALPGRIVGVSIDTHGRTAYRLALQTREQHIRREKATSNICTAQVLLAVIASMYGVYHGPDGLRKIASRIHQYSCVLASGLKALGWRVRTNCFFDTITVETDGYEDAVFRCASEQGINLRRVPSGGITPAAIGISCDEMTTREIIEKVWHIFASANGLSRKNLSFADFAKNTTDQFPSELTRKSEFMTHPVFHRHRSETELLRYMRRLSDRDLALDRSMISLGSCTMKLNATAEMVPITWPEFSDLHPFVPPDQSSGYAQLISDLSHWLCEITGYDAFSLQPNSGAQGEYAGLLAIRAYHATMGQDCRTVCLIPSSAHGTNPASAQLAGMEVVVVDCDQSGNVDLEDLREKARANANRLAAIMVTYPSTHGVFEENIREICEIVHVHGGQVYLDGANLNAQVGFCRPGDYGADVSHINLHKTFCIPHGGGGPGVGPIGVKAHLAPFLPGHPERPDLISEVGPVSAAPIGSALILTISWAYIAMMGGTGLTKATQVAICKRELRRDALAQLLSGAVSRPMWPSGA